MTETEKSKFMRTLRQRRKEAGLVEVRAWLTPQQKKRVEKMLEDYKKANLKKLGEG